MQENIIDNIIEQKSNAEVDVKPEEISLEQQEKNKLFISQFGDYSKNIKKMLEQNVNEDLANEYDEFVKSCDSLVSEIESYGNKVISLEDKDKLLQSYQNVANNIDTIVNSKKYEAEDIKTQLNDFGGYIAKDIRSLAKMNKEQTIFDISKNGRKRTIDISNQDITHLGANMSDRQVINDGNSQKIFTKSESFNFVDKCNNHINSYIKKYPQYQEYFKMFASKRIIENFHEYPIRDSEGKNGYLNVNILNKGIITVREGIYDRIDKIKKTDKLSEADKKIEIENCENDLQKIYSNGITQLKALASSDPVFNSIIADYLDGLWKLQNQKSFMHTINHSADEPIDERNSGMSVMAGLLGIGNVICHSEPVTIKNGEEVIEGTLMDFAEGTDPSHLDTNDPIATFKADEIKVTGEANKQISNVQVLDYLCGNVDRHAGNMFIKYDCTDKLNPKVIGVQGIDNDSSFIERHGEGLETYNKMIGLSVLQFIDEQTANKIKTLSPSMVKLSLQGLKIGPKAIEGVLKRLSNLQTVLNKNAIKVENNKDIILSNHNNKLENIKINVIKSNDWNKIKVQEKVKTLEANNKSSLDDILESKKNSNLFLQTYRNMAGVKNLDDKDFIHEKINDSIRKLIDQRLESRRNIEIHSDSLDKNTKLFRSSPQYRAVMSALKSVRKAERKMKSRATPEAVKSYIDKMETLKQKARLYVTKKNNEKPATGYSDYTNGRITAVSGIIRDIDDRINKYNSLHTEINDKYTILNEREVMISASKSIQEQRKKEREDELKQKKIESNKGFQEKVKGDTDPKFNNDLNKSKAVSTNLEMNKGKTTSK